MIIFYSLGVGNWEMCGVRDNIRGIKDTLRGRNYFNSKLCGMEYESDWTKHKKSSAFTAQVIRSATSFMHWSCKMPIGDGFHEYL